MLRQLAIRHLAIIEALTLDFAPGFTVLSGETGAGKSILIEALGLVLGDRADATLVRAGQPQADVAAEFALGARAPARAWLREHALDHPDDADLCVLRRVVGADGRSRAFINGASATLAQLRELGEQLVEIHGQHEHQRLLHTDVQREQLDDFAGHEALLDAVAMAARRHAAAAAAMQRLRASAARDPAQLDYLRHQIRELEALDLQPASLEQLFADHRRLANAGRLLQEGGAVEEQLYGSESGAYALLARVQSSLGALGDLDAAFGEALQLVAGAQTQVQEAAATVRRALDRLDLDPERLAEIEQRMSALHELARKHRVRAEELLARRDALRAEVAGSEGAEAALERLQQEQDAALADYRAAAQKLGASRRKAAKDFASQVGAELRALGMARAELAIAVETVAGTAPAVPRAHGDDEVRFDFTANAGQPPRPLARVASGGELSRVSLAIQLVATRSRSAATLIFDEVDAGVGGGTAETVGVKLRELARRRQTLCVTHLPQVAAQGQQHFAIHKEVRGGQTVTRVTPLDAAQRVAELARMLGGREITASTEAHAQEMLKRAARG
ncbi:MAG TPA: DNA repair protein RecN [Candidatus Binatia bacterium]|nr:DNA repair protein RecN [Candidatus Binatia bacterium]